MYCAHLTGEGNFVEIIIMQHHLIDTLARTVEQACAAPTNTFGYGIWTHHISKVAANSVHLASVFGADPEIVEIAALLHDYASVKDRACSDDHHIQGAVEAEKLLRQFNYPPHKIEAVKDCIMAHRASVRVEQRSAEAICLANADALTHIQYVPSLLYFVYVHEQMGIDEGAAWVRAKLQRSWDKLSESVRDMAYKQYQAALQVLGDTTA